MLGEKTLFPPECERDALWLKTKLHRPAHRQHAETTLKQGPAESCYFPRFPIYIYIELTVVVETSPRFSALPNAPKGLPQRLPGGPKDPPRPPKEPQGRT